MVIMGRTVRSQIMMAVHWSNSLGGLGLLGNKETSFSSLLYSFFWGERGGGKYTKPSKQVSLWILATSWGFLCPRLCLWLGSDALNMFWSGPFCWVIGTSKFKPKSHVIVEIWAVLNHRELFGLEVKLLVGSTQKNRICFMVLCENSWKYLVFSSPFTSALNPYMLSNLDLLLLKD